MFELLAALFGGTYLYGKVSAEKSATERFEKVQNNRIAKLKDIQENKSNFDSDREMELYISDPQYYESIKKTLEQSLIKYFDSYSAKKMLDFVLPENYFEGSSVDRTSPMARLLRILRAIEGRYLYWDVFGSVQDLTRKPIYLEYFKWVNAELKANNANDIFVLVAVHYPTYNESTAFTLDRAEEIYDRINMSEFTLRTNCTYKFAR